MTHHPVNRSSSSTGRGFPAPSRAVLHNPSSSWINPCPGLVPFLPHSATAAEAAAAAERHQTLVAVSCRHDAAAARAAALHQLTRHMCHAWLLLYGCCCLMLLPSLLAWLRVPTGELLLPCFAVSLPAGVCEHLLLSCCTCCVITEKQHMHLVGMKYQTIHGFYFMFVCDPSWNMCPLCSWSSP